MSNFVVCLNAVLPIFIIMALGYGVRCLGLISREDVPRLNKMFFRVFMPVMLFYDIYESDLSSAIRPALIAYAAGSVLAVYFLCLLIVSRREKDPTRKGVMIQGLYRSNFVIIGIPLAQSLMGPGSDIGPVVVLITIIVPMFNALAVITLEYFRGGKPDVWYLVRQILKNPLIIGTVAGLLFLALGIKLPQGIEDAVSDIGDATSPILLFLLGAFFRFDGFRGNLRDVAFVSIGRLIVIPGIVLGVAVLLGFCGVEIAGLIAIFASATAVASFTMAQQMGGDAALAGDIVVATSALCPLTLFLWSLLLTPVLY